VDFLTKISGTFSHSFRFFLRVFHKFSRGDGGIALACVGEGLSIPPLSEKKYLAGAKASIAKTTHLGSRARTMLSRTFLTPLDMPSGPATTRHTIDRCEAWCEKRECTTEMTLVGRRDRAAKGIFASLRQRDFSLSRDRPMPWPRVGDPRFAEVAKGMPKETGDHLVRWQLQKATWKEQERVIRKLQF
jgi:hypothetical protein